MQIYCNLDKYPHSPNRILLYLLESDTYHSLENKKIVDIPDADWEEIVKLKSYQEIIDNDPGAIREIPNNESPPDDGGDNGGDAETKTETKTKEATAGTTETPPSETEESTAGTTETRRKLRKSR